MKLLPVFALAAALAQAQQFDVLITNARIVDGTGNPSWIGDIGIRGNRIAASAASPDSPPPAPSTRAASSPPPASSTSTTIPTTRC